MKRRDLLLTGAAAGLAAGGLGWLLVRELTAPRNVAPVEIGDAFPAITGKLLSGRSMTVPRDLHGDLGLLILTWDDVAENEMAMWRQELMEVYGLLPGLRVMEVAMISNVGPVLGEVIDHLMERGTPLPERENALVVYGDLRRQRLQLDTAMTALPHASVFLIDRHGRLAWRADGPPTMPWLESLRRTLEQHGVEMTS